MIRRGVVITLVFVLALAIRASAEPPHQADIDACNKEAAVAPQPAASPDLGKPSAPAEPRPNTKTEDGASAAQPTKGPDAATTPGERQAFAACLARHGYYKGYYH
jgi:hypothetical protein